MIPSVTQETKAKPLLTLVDAELHAWGRAVQIEYERWAREVVPESTARWLMENKPDKEECLEALEKYLCA